MRYVVIILSLLIFQPSLAQEMNVNELYEQGIEAWNDRKYESAREYFNRVISMDPGLLEAYLYRADALEQLDLPEQAIVDYLVYLNVYPERVEVLLSASVLNYRLKRYMQAKEGFLDLLNLPPGVTSKIYFKQPLHGEGTTGMFTAQSKDRSFLFNYLGLCEEGLNQFSKALSYLDTAISIQPSTPDYYVNRGSLHKKVGNRSKAESDFRKALELNPDYSLAHYNLALLLEESGDDLAAISYYSQSIEDNPSSPLAYRNRGYRFLRNGDLDLALKDFNKALELDPKNVETYVNRGVVYNAKKQYESALADFGKAIQLKPDFEKAYFNRGNTLYHLKEYQNALNDYNVALIYNPSYAQALYQRALTNYYLENYSQACTDIIKAHQLKVQPAAKAKLRICRDSPAQ